MRHAVRPTTFIIRHASLIIRPILIAHLARSENVPLLGGALAAASCAVTLWAESNALAPNAQFPLRWRIGNALISYVTYLGQFFYPVGLAVAYPRAGLDLPMGKVLGAFLLLAGITAAAVLWRRNRPYLLVGWAWYLADVAADHRAGAVRRSGGGRPLHLLAADRAVHRPGVDPGRCLPAVGGDPAPWTANRHTAWCLLHSAAGRPALPRCWQLLR